MRKICGSLLLSSLLACSGGSTGTMTEAATNSDGTSSTTEGATTTATATAGTATSSASTTDPDVVTTGTENTTAGPETTGAATGEPDFTCLLDIEGWQCPIPDLDACTCFGCNNNGSCPVEEDCVCPDCMTAEFTCQPDECVDDGECNPAFEGCLCDDCVAHPACTG